MSKTNDELANKLASKNSLSPARLDKTLEAWYKQQSEHLLQLGGGDERLVSQVFACAEQEIMRNPDLMGCTIQSLRHCIRSSIALGIFAGPMKECCYVPRRNKRNNNQMEANFQLEYPALVRLAIQGGACDAISAAVVYEADDFDFQEGSEPYLRHKRFLGSKGKRGERVCAYATAMLPSGKMKFVILTMDDIESIKGRSLAAGSDFSPWNNKIDEDFDEMCKKTAIIRLTKTLPKGLTALPLARAVEADNEAERPDLIKTSVLPGTFNNSDDTEESMVPVQNPPSSEQP